MTNSYIPILIMMIAAGALGAVMLGLNWILGRHQRNPSKLAPYQIAMLFILFDIEAAFLYPWAVIYRDATRTSSALAWFVFGEMLLFILLLAVGYVYCWKKRAFDWK